MASMQCNKPSQDTNHHHDVQSSTHTQNHKTNTEHSFANKVKEMAGKMFSHEHNSKENRCQKHEHGQVHSAAAKTEKEEKHGNNCMPIIREHMNMHKHKNKTKKKRKEGKHTDSSDSSNSDSDNDARKKKD